MHLPGGNLSHQEQKAFVQPRNPRRCGYSGVIPKSMESKRQPGLYFIGEVVDVTGHLGGFNLQWAWSSAMQQERLVKQWQNARSIIILK
jgi:hypothetical protein